MFSSGWELILKADDNSEPYFFSGALLEGSITIFGSRSNVNFQKFLTGLMRINTEQANKIRELEKTLKDSLGPDPDLSTNFMDELSRLNNELVEMQRELSKKNMELGELNNLKNQFLGMAAHDLRNPLGIMINYSEFLEEDKENFTEEQTDFIKKIKSLSTFMLGMVTELLDVTAIEAGSINLNLEQTDLVSLVESNVQLNKALAEKKSISLNFQSKVQSFLLSLDKGKIDQVVSNLITNAIKYSNPETEVAVFIEKNETEAIISVKDQGQGIEKDELQLLFKPFQRTSVKSTGGEKSTGLGLFIVRRIIEAHNGSIRVESEVGKGSTFFVALPDSIKLIN